MATKATHLIFDLDGTLVDSRQDLADSINRVLGVRGLPILTFEGVVANVGRGATHLVRECLPPAARDEATVAEVLEAFRVDYAEHLTDATTAYPGIPEVLAELAGRAQLAVLTNKPGALARQLLDELGLSAHFARILGPDDVGARKPDPAGLTRVCELLEADPGASWYVGDMALDIETARGAGCPGARVAWGFETLTDDAGEDRLLAEPGELLELVT